jgi:SagB-type dehydrogenase family enzyme
MDMLDYRNFLKSNAFKEIDSSETDQGKKVPEPPLQKSCPADAKIIDLVSPDKFTCGQTEILTLMRNRKSRRIFTSDGLTMEEFSYLLWSVQGVKKIVKNGYATLRTVPSAGARHPFETYIFVFNVEGLNKGIYRYLPLEHKLITVQSKDNIESALSEACFGQKFVSKGAVTFIWTAIPYRSEWRYSIASHKCIALDAGHLCQNLYLAAESINAGTCAIAAYDQEKMDALLGIDGSDEFTIYLAPVGKQRNE